MGIFGTRAELIKRVKLTHLFLSVPLYSVHLDMFVRVEAANE